MTIDLQTAAQPFAQELGGSAGCDPSAPHLGGEPEVAAAVGPSRPLPPPEGRLSASCRVALTKASRLCRNAGADDMGAYWAWERRLAPYDGVQGWRQVSGAVEAESMPRKAAICANRRAVAEERSKKDHRTVAVMTLYDPHHTG